MVFGVPREIAAPDGRKWQCPTLYRLCPAFLSLIPALSVVLRKKKTQPVFRSVRFTWSDKEANLRKINSRQLGRIGARVCKDEGERCCATEWRLLRLFHSVYFTHTATCYCFPLPAPLETFTGSFSCRKIFHDAWHFYFRTDRNGIASWVLFFYISFLL